MFDFEKLSVYQKAKSFHREVFHFIKASKNLDSITINLLRRASLSIMLNIAEGSSRFSKADRRNFYVISRGSAFECVAIFDFLVEEKFMVEELHQNFYSKAEELSKMLFKMIEGLSN